VASTAYHPENIQRHRTKLGVGISTDDRKINTAHEPNASAALVGFIQRIDGDDSEYYCGLDAVEGSHRFLAVGQRVTFSVTMDTKGRNMAKAVKLLRRTE
jgi:cold shock CspA family protein